MRGIEERTGRLCWVSTPVQEPHQTVFWTAGRSAPAAPPGRAGREAPETHAGGTAAEGAVTAGSEGKGWGRSQGGKGRGRTQPSRPQRPEMARGWVGTQVGLGTERGGLSCGLRTRAGARVGAPPGRLASAPAGRRREGQAAWSQNQSGRASALESGVQPRLLPWQRKPPPRPWG